MIINQIKEIVELNENKGVQPWELVKNISTEGYLAINTKKVNDKIICSVKIEDEEIFTEKKYRHTYQYMYDENMVLLEILSIHQNQTSIVWNRDNNLKEAINKLLISMSILSDDDRMKFINNLPKHLRSIMLEDYIKIS